MTEINREPIEAPEAGLSGPEIVDDLLDRIASELSKSCHLTTLCCYRSYSARGTLSLQLNDFDTAEVRLDTVQGAYDPARPSRLTAIEFPAADAREVRGRSGSGAPSLARSVDGSDPSPATPARRYYTPRAKKAG
jgi:hypothetical protein